MRVLFVVWAVLVGLAIGSFLTVAVYRIPRRMSLFRPRSHCPSCGTTLRARDNIPVVSWVLLRGRCAACGSPTSVRYPAIEILTAVAFGLGAILLTR